MDNLENRGENKESIFKKTIKSQKSLKHEKINSDLDMNNIDVIVIGAGISGVSCAEEIIRKTKKNVLILEARNRIGGRINSINVEGTICEVGASFIHGASLLNPLYSKK